MMFMLERGDLLAVHYADNFGPAVVWFNMQTMPWGEFCFQFLFGPFLDDR